uniref:Transposase InsQ for insertion sequence element IS609 n=1 Tax=Klebsiella pneumoniae TaxID=573 RepID=A0A8B0SWB2_KLEPN|nr:Putative transposase InsQ for insertion sequence element IS609 [Klebsiella pneumoniae]
MRQKSGLNRAILDQGWYEMRRQLEYKQRWRGGEVLAVNPAYTSQKCARCGHTVKEKSSIAGSICLRGVWIRSERRHKRRSKIFSRQDMPCCPGLTPDAPVRRRKPLSEEPGNAVTRCYPTKGIPFLIHVVRRWGRMSSS